MKEKELYCNLNEMDFFNNFLQGNIFVLAADVAKLHELLQHLEAKVNLPSGQLIPSHCHRLPTHFTTNAFTRSAQEIVETYGVANYQ